MNNESIRRQIAGRAIPIRGDEIDTDRIIPARYLRTVTFDDLGTHVFEDDRAGGDHPFDDTNYKGASILVANANFGCGSSREHAPWALSDFGIRCVIAPSFADIFYNNCFQNGLLPVTLDEAAVAHITAQAKEIPGYAVTIDLENCLVSDNEGFTVAFDLDEFKQYCLLNGLDDIGITLKSEDAITAYEEKRDA